MASLTATEKKALKLFTERLHEAFPERVQELQLFGSKARGDASKYSDVDVLVVLKDRDGRTRRRVSSITADILLETGVVLSPKTLSRIQFEQMKGRRSMFWQSIQHDLTPLAQ